MLKEWESAWNKGDIEKLLSLHHPESRLRKGYESSDQGKKEIVDDFSKMEKENGKIVSISLGKYIEKSGKFVVKFTYEEKGLIPGTMKFQNNGDGKWFVLDFNFDGQGEPELKE